MNPAEKQSRSPRDGAMSESNSQRSPLVRNAIFLLALISIALVVHNIFGQNGYLAARRERRQLQTLEEQIQLIKQENQQLGKANEALKRNPAAIERLAREQMHLAKPGEKIYTLPNRTASPVPAPSGGEIQP
jgi:cell division protein FtsB